MRIRLDDTPGHEGIVGWRLPDGSLNTADEQPADLTGYRAMCSCGWIGATDHPPGEVGSMSASSEWVEHMQPLWAAAPPAWLLNRSESLRDDLSDLAVSRPLQALGVLATVESWQKPLTERAVLAARDAGLSWTEIGAALGITRQSAHERFSPAVRNRATGG